MMRHMKKVAAALISIVILATAAGLLLLRPFSKDGKSTAEMVARGKSKNEPGRSEPNAGHIAQLAEQKNPSARDQLVAMYVGWAGKPEGNETRRAIVREILRNEDPAVALEMIVTAVSQDPIPLKSDDMLTSVARDLAAVWTDAPVFTKGLDLLRLSDNAKAQALLAESLADRLLSPPSGFENLDSQRYALLSDLMHMYREGPQDPDLKSQLLENIRAVGGPEMAELAMDPMNPRAAFFRKMEAEQQEARRAAPPP